MPFPQHAWSHSIRITLEMLPVHLARHSLMYSPLEATPSATVLVRLAQALLNKDAMVYIRIMYSELYLYMFCARVVAYSF